MTNKIGFSKLKNYYHKLNKFERNPEGNLFREEFWKYF